jgi:hypothetical protein
VAVELNLARAIKNEKGVVFEVTQVTDEILDVLDQVLHAVHKPTVGSEIHQFLNIV